jgi:hypothetical protein
MVGGRGRPPANPKQPLSPGKIAAKQDQRSITKMSQLAHFRARPATPQASSSSQSSPEAWVRMAAAMRKGSPAPFPKSHQFLSPLVKQEPYYQEDEEIESWQPFGEEYEQEAGTVADGMVQKGLSPVANCNYLPLLLPSQDKLRVLFPRTPLVNVEIDEIHKDWAKFTLTQSFPDTKTLDEVFGKNLTPPTVQLHLPPREFEISFNEFPIHCSEDLITYHDDPKGTWVGFTAVRNKDNSSFVKRRK